MLLSIFSCKKGTWWYIKETLICSITELEFHSPMQRQKITADDTDGHSAEQNSQQTKHSGHLRSTGGLLSLLQRSPNDSSGNLPPTLYTPATSPSVCWLTQRTHDMQVQTRAPATKVVMATSMLTTCSCLNTHLVCGDHSFFPKLLIFKQIFPKECRLSQLVFCFRPRRDN